MVSPVASSHSFMLIFCHVALRSCHHTRAEDHLTASHICADEVQCQTSSDPGRHHQLLSRLVEGRDHGPDILQACKSQDPCPRLGLTRQPVLKKYITLHTALYSTCGTQKCVPQTVHACRRQEGQRNLLFASTSIHGWLHSGSGQSPTTSASSSCLGLC